MKKRIISLIALVVLGLMTAFAQVPTTPLTYQTVVRNAQNQLVINQENVTVTVSVWNGAGTSELYRETHSGLSTNANGLLTLMMGTGTVNLGTWADIDWSDAAIKTTVSYGSVTIPSDLMPVTAVPYAMQAGNVPANVSAFTNDAGYITITDVPGQVNADWNATSGVSQILNKPDLSVYATNEALNTFQTQTNNTLTGINSNITNLQSQITSNDNDILALQNSDATINNRITADSTVLHNALIDTAAAIRGNIHNATLTIQTNGTTTGTFTANQAADATINIDVPAAQVQSNWTEADNTQASFIQNKPTLATVATSGDYNDLSNQPAINDATLTIQKNGTEVGTFTANQASAATINVTVPTTVAELTDASDYATLAGNNVFTGANDFTAGSVTVPNAISDLRTTLASACTQDAVSLCDLFAVFDSLTRRMDSISQALATTQQELSDLMEATMPVLVLSSNKPENIRAGSGEEVKVKYEASIQRMNADFSYSWYVNDVLQDGETLDSLKLTLTTAGTFKVLCKATAGSTVLKDSLTTTLCFRPSLEYTLVGGNSADFGKVSIISSTATSAVWSDPYGTEIGTWNSGLTDVLPYGTYTVVLTSDDGCDSTMTIQVMSSPLCLTRSVASYEESISWNGRNYVTAVKDHQDNSYRVVNIGGDCWTRENMRCTEYYDAGTSSYIEIPDGASSGSASIAYRYDPATGNSLDAHGYLYNWTAAVGNAASSITADDEKAYVRGVCPEGWHLPSYYDFYYMKHPQVTNATANAGKLAGSQPVETWAECCEGTSAPGNYSYSERNSTGFSALRSGYNEGNGYYRVYGAYFWNCYRYGSYPGYGIFFGVTQTSEPLLTNVFKEFGMSVRCVRDTTASLGLSRNPATQQVASGTSVTYTATIVNDNPADYTYIWNVDGAAQGGSSATFSYTFSAGGTHTVSCEATGNGNTLTRSLTTVVE